MTNFFIGSCEPSWFSEKMVSIGFWTTFYVAQVYEWLKSPFVVEQSSIPAQALRNVLRIGKSICTFKTIKDVRFSGFHTLFKPFRKDHLNVFLNHSIGIWSGTDYPATRVVMYVHGGGYVSGDIASFIGIVDRMATHFECPFFLPQYRLSPEFSILDMITDLMDALQHVQERYPNVPIHLIGDSAGGGLCLWLLNEIVQRDNNIIVSCAICSPMIDLRCNSWSFKTNAGLDPCLDTSTVRLCADVARDRLPVYLNPWVNWKWEKFPPIRISVDAEEILFSDSILAHQHLSNAILKIHKGLFHAFFVFYPCIEKECIQEMDEISNFFRSTSSKA